MTGWSARGGRTTRGGAGRNATRWGARIEPLSEDNRNWLRRAAAASVVPSLAVTSDQEIRPSSVENRPQVGFPRIGVRQYFEAEHLWAARLAAHLCRQREDELLTKGFRGVDYQVRSFAVMAIQESVAFLEARVNTVWQDAADREEGAEVGNPRLDGLTVETIVLLRELWKYDPVQRSLSLLEKFDAVLRTARKPEMDKSRSPFQDIEPLIRLRNALVHFKPETQWSDEVHHLEARLQHRIPANPLMAGTGPWFPHHPLCAGVAEWAWRSCVAFAQEWEARLDLTDRYLESMEAAAPWPDR